MSSKNADQAATSILRRRRDVLSRRAKSKAVLQASKTKLQKLAAEERARGEASKQKNDLESYIISFQGRLAEDESLLAVTTEAQREAFNDALTAAEDWLYSDGESQAANVFR